MLITMKQIISINKRPPQLSIIRVYKHKQRVKNKEKQKTKEYGIIIESILSCKRYIFNPKYA